MQLIVYPEGLFRADFDVLLDDAKRQEEAHPANKGERGIAAAIHTFFDLHAMRLVRHDEWVYEAAKRFVTEYAIDCFRHLRLGGAETYPVQKRLWELNTKTVDLLARAGLAGAAPQAGQVDLAKASDFITLIDFQKAPSSLRVEAESLHSQLVEHEDLQMWVTLRAIRDNYETTLPRIMFVVRRVIKVMKGLPPKKSDNRLTGLSEYLDWYESNVDRSHPLFSVLGNLRTFYRVARNVASHHEGFSWLPDSDQIVLEDFDERLSMHVHEFQQRYRYLIYLGEFGLRGILCAFCGRDQGDVSNNLVREYAKTFPDDFPEGTPARVKFYQS
jgi:hypothetical protein